MWMLGREAAGGIEAAGALGAGDAEERALCTGRCRPLRAGRVSGLGSRVGLPRFMWLGGLASKGKGRG